MFINKKELDRRVSEANNLVERMRVPRNPHDPSSRVASLDTSKFKIDGTNRSMPLYSPEQRALAAAVAMTAGGDIAEEVTGVRAGYAEMLTRGEYSQATDPEERDKRNQELKESIYKSLSDIRGVAAAKLMRVMKLINKENLDAIPAKDRARLAAQMANQLSGVIDRTINKGEHLTDGRSTHLHLYAPEQRPISAFEIKRINPKANDDAISSTE